MEKPRPPHVVRTWTVERTKLPSHFRGPLTGVDPKARPPKHNYLPKPSRRKPVSSEMNKLPGLSGE
jgi:hypothetical protein